MSWWISGRPYTHTNNNQLTWTQWRPENLLFFRDEEFKWNMWHRRKVSFVEWNINVRGEETSIEGYQDSIHSTTYNDTVSANTIIKHYYFQSFVNPHDIYDRCVIIISSKSQETNYYPVFRKW